MEKIEQDIAQETAGWQDFFQKLGADTPQKALAEYEKLVRKILKDSVEIADLKQRANATTVLLREFVSRADALIKTGGSDE